MVWDFSKIINSKYDREDEYCSEGATCSFPDSHEPGMVSIDMPESWVDKLDTVISNKDELNFSALIGGTNDYDDCKHNGIDFEVTIQHVN